MSEKKFIVVDHSTCVFDRITKEEYVCIDTEEAFLVYKRLNEQQTTISALKEENEQLKKEYKIAIDEMVTDYKKLEKENEQLRKQVESSETTSDATSNYNAHLESKITTLEKENEQLRKDVENLQEVVAELGIKWVRL